MTTLKTLKIDGSLKASSLAVNTIYAAVQKETEKAYQIIFNSDNSIAAYTSWVPKSCISVNENGNLVVKAWFFEKEIAYKIVS